MNILDGTKLAGALAISLIVGACASTGSDTDSDVDTSTETTQELDPRSTEYLIENVGNQVFFGFDRHNIDSQDEALLREVAGWMKEYPGIVVQLAGNCDERGTREYNIALGARRANAAKDFLVSEGVDAARLRTISYGKERPTCTQSTESCWAENRNTTITVLDAGASS